MRRGAFLSATLVFALVVSGLPPLPAVAAGMFVERTFTAPIDGFSVKMSTTSFRYSTLKNSVWSDIRTYEDDGDGAPGSESELIMVPRGTVGLRLSGIANASDIHEIAVSHEPAAPRVASTESSASTAILSRAEWGADGSYLYPRTTPLSDTKPDPDASKGDNGGGSGQTDQRVKDCMQAQKDNPAEFKYDSVVTKDAQGKAYLWPLQYSKTVRMLVVHHSALTVKDDPRPAVERVRAIYKYHAITKGWGDIGYHYVIDENGQIYEGRQGGKYVVGGHAYCNNVGTVGIVLLGNFEMEQPSQRQAKSLQWLLSDLAKTYSIDPKASIQFHGKKFDAPIVRHRDLLSTLCPGYELAGAFDQIVKHVQDGLLDSPVTFPPMPGTQGTPPPAPPPPGVQEGIGFTGRTSVSINPGGKQRLSFTYTAGREGAYEGKRVADVRLSDPDIKLMVDDGREWIPVTTGILLPSDLPAYETVSLQLVVQAPMNPGSYSMDIGGIHFTLSIYGRRARSGDFVSPFTAQKMLVVTPKAPPRSTTVVARIRPQSRMTLSPSSSASAVTPLSSSNDSAIRIKLSASLTPVIRFADNGLADGSPVAGGTALTLLLRNGQCEADQDGSRVASADQLRFSSTVSGILNVDGIAGTQRSYHGVLECRVVGTALTLINELPLEEYMAGISEEPDTEPYEKQRAFAVAARTYAAYYMSGSNRKFPGMPYDGSDDPALFQVYAGVRNEAENPRWAKAVVSTSGEVLKYQNRIFKPAYFSSDDGRTRSPAEAGWSTFPASEIFVSKPDPWCKGMTLRGHGVGMSGCGAEGQANEGRSAEQILQYYYPGSRIVSL